MKRKLWLCGMTQNRLDDINEMTQPEVMEHFDGLVFTDGFSTDGTYELLNERKKEGKIVQRKWTNDHDLQMNEFLRCGAVKNMDWFVILDSPERITPKWLETIHKDIEGYEKKGVGAVFMSGRPYLAKYYDHMFIYPSPHWGLHGWSGNPLSVDDRKKDLLVENKRNDAPEDSYLIHPTKYYYVYGRSNHMNLVYGQFGGQVTNSHETTRLKFRLYCEDVLGLSLDSLDSLEEYMRKDPQTFPQDFIDVVELEFCLTDFFRLKVLEQDFMEEIVENRYNWSFVEYIKTGKTNQPKDKSIGAINEYRKRKGMPQEEPGHVYDIDISPELEQAGVTVTHDDEEDSEKRYVKTYD